jgi:hypothetical protein
MVCKLNRQSRTELFSALATRHAGRWTVGSTDLLTRTPPTPPHPTNPSRPTPDLIAQAPPRPLHCAWRAQGSGPCPRIWLGWCRWRGTGSDRRGSLSPPRPAVGPCAPPSMAQLHRSRRSQLQSIRSQALVELSDCSCLRSLPRLGEVVGQLLFERQVAQPPLAIVPEILQLLPY